MRPTFDLPESQIVALGMQKNCVQDGFGEAIPRISNIAKETH